MCDYSLHSVKSRPAKVGDKLVTHNFNAGTRGLRLQKTVEQQSAFLQEQNSYFQRTWCASGRVACFGGGEQK